MEMDYIKKTDCDECGKHSYTIRAIVTKDGKMRNMCVCCAETNNSEKLSTLIHK